MANEKETGKKKGAFARYSDALGVVFVLIVVGVVLFFIKTTPITFKPITDADILAIITSLFVVAVFMERSIEALLVPARKPDRKDIELEIKKLEARVKEGESDKKEDLLAKKQELVKYRLQTGRIAMWGGFVFGLLISIVGVRALAGLVDFTDASKIMEDTYELQRTLFNFVDVVITGGVIAGGSAAIDKIGRRISETLKTPKEPTKEPTKE